MRIFLTGRPGSGKSTVVARIIERLQGKKLAGILTPEIRAGMRKGFEIVDIASGSRAIMASMSIKSKHRVSKYGVDLDAINKITQKFLASLPSAEFIIIDEIGKMELLSDSFKRALMAALRSEKPMLATIGRQFVKDYAKYGKLLIVTKENRNRLPDEIFKLFQEHEVKQS